MTGEGHRGGAEKERHEQSFCPLLMTNLDARVPLAASRGTDRGNISARNRSTPWGAVADKNSLAGTFSALARTLRGAGFFHEQFLHRHLFIPWDFFPVRDMDPVLTPFAGRDDDVTATHLIDGVRECFAPVENF